MIEQFGQPDPAMFTESAAAERKERHRVVQDDERLARKVLSLSD
jgi:hypothetical protein